MPSQGVGGLEGEPERQLPATGTGVGFRAVDLPAVFELLARIGRAAVATLGADCEVVVHDLRHPEHSVVAISGNLTGRQVGAPIPDPQLLPGEVDNYTDDDLRHTATTLAGRELLASTAWVRDTRGHIVGAICINVDRSGLVQARDLIDAHLGSDEPNARLITSFASDVAEFTQAAVASLIGRGPRRRLNRVERVGLLRRLDCDGIFALRGAADAIATELGISRSSIYTDLRAARKLGPDVVPGVAKLIASRPETARRDSREPRRLLIAPDKEARASRHLTPLSEGGRARGTAAKNSRRAARAARPKTG